MLANAQKLMKYASRPLTECLVWVLNNYIHLDSREAHDIVLSFYIHNVFFE